MDRLAIVLPFIHANKRRFSKSYNFSNIRCFFTSCFVHRATVMWFYSRFLCVSGALKFSSKIGHLISTILLFCLSFFHIRCFNEPFSLRSTLLVLLFFYLYSLLFSTLLTRRKVHAF